MNRVSLSLLWVVSCGLPAITVLNTGCDGCGSKTNGTTTSTSTNTSSTSTSTPPSPAASVAWKGTLRARGSAGRIFRAVQTLTTLNEEQQVTLGKIGTELQNAEKAARSSEQDAGFVKGELKAAHAEMLEGVRAGSVDLAKLNAHEAALARADEARHKREAEALNRTQRALEPAQRAAVAAAVRGTSHPAPGKPDAAVPGRSDAQAPAAGAATHTGDAGVSRRPPEVNWARARFENYMTGLGLDPEQDKKIKAILDTESAPDVREEEGQRLEALAAAFEKEGFDANHFPFGDPQDGRGPLFRLGRFLAKVMPVLKPEQHSKLATKLVDADTPPRKRRPLGVVGAPVPRETDDDPE